MKRGIISIVFCITSLFVISSMSHAAEIKCGAMDIVLVGETGLWLKNVSGQPCGNIANGSQQYFVFQELKLDRQLAIALTSVSLNKSLWVNALDDTAGSILNVVAMRN